MSITFEELKKNHPCFALGAKNNKGRVHLPVSPGCNIFCSFCKREISDTENRPGVASGIITPEEAIEVVRKAVKLCPEITVVGVAGPGDTLATPYALQTFRLIKEEFPDIIKCMSTNGLLLPEYADEIIDVGIDSLTVTVNAVDPDIQAQICEGIVYHGKCYTGRQAAEILIKNQLIGIQKVSGAGITVKVNTVLIPEINADHVAEVAKTVSEHGAKIYNIIPLIPQHHLSWCSEPKCDLISKVRQEAENYIRVFRHCQRCRADAAGIPGGKDVSGRLYIRPVVLENTFSHG
ncbi:MAG: nitrogen fixation protein NifB [Epulopiscium sp.]|jgi:nitrogen fixation protein NifB|uniref:FeMo cofactor biosynthesis protein NifB n=1 Tax=Defluviitalea raffinosedens TaxID=1450156 RepID=A0A7C8HIE4_9FIRM|nr:radical SAM protein [Defluviitalea raffinosedens]MBZ4667625.1 Radical domain protein [Defluviitaleaceae bacterium]MDK2787108.1 nitrogen fixation protein NifB [Candidatus Epulonipiscium sp.]KAE9634884.1 radical SAM protein [Defluviitalea raffinosedens]MBM7685671.1 nitrogen fixation protein NifB [Defluviitalea raffinosedens]HHW66517.1 radical SAM protein [Candidatus Epulonipiscium sp.]